MTALIIITILNIVVCLTSILINIRTANLMRKVVTSTIKLTVLHEKTIDVIKNNLVKSIINALFILQSSDEDAKKKLLSLTKE
jgi:hypothetical protein